MAVAGIRGAPVGSDGAVIWHARTVPELADAVRTLAGMLAAVEAPAPVPPDLSGYVPLADFQALQAEVGVLTGRVTALETGLATLDGEVDAQGTDLTALEDRVTALEAPAP
jgi:phage I-like protein